MGNEYFKKLNSTSCPKIYVYETPDVKTHEGFIKIGYTTKNSHKRIKQQLSQARIRYNFLFEGPAMKEDGTFFTDKDIHSMMKNKNIDILEKDSEWFRCTKDEFLNIYNEFRFGIKTDNKNRNKAFKMRDEQKEAVEKTCKYFNNWKNNQGPAKFLWNCKMRFGKTFTAYQLIKKLEYKKVLILTFKPAVESSWKDDLETHVDFDEWQFVSHSSAKISKISIDQQFNECDKQKPIIVFGSLQNLLGKNENGGIKAKNEFIHKTNWDLVIFDEYHFGAWRENSKSLFSDYDDEKYFDIDYDELKKEEVHQSRIDETFLPITTNRYLYLSGTPFRSLNNGEFIEEEIFSWTYSDEQKKKQELGNNKNNPYLALPKMILMAYQLPDDIKEIAINNELNEFDLNTFFKTEGKGKDAKFIYQDYVQKWLDLIRGEHLPTSIDNLKSANNQRPPMPYSDSRLLANLLHTLWFLPDVSSCYAMYNLLKQKNNIFYHDYTINLCAGKNAGIGLDALKPVRDSMGKDGKTPLETKTITLTCGKLTTGVTIKPWSAVFMLRNLKTPETYFQAAFRAQSSWTVKDENQDEEIIKHECYIFDFSLNRALKQINDYACELVVDGSRPEKKIADFIKFLPVLAYDGIKMVQLDSQDILDITTTGTSATLLAKKWESALLVNVDNNTLQKIINNPEVLDALMNIEGFRSLNKDIEIIINKSEHVKEIRSKDEKLTDKQKKELSKEEKEYRSKRKEIQEKLIKFATRIPIFMYLTDFREHCLKDVITQLEPELFKKVTGLSINDFDSLCKLNVFNSSKMNDAIYKFKRYEDSSLSYSGIIKEKGSTVGGWDTTIDKIENKRIFYNQ